MTAKQKYKHKVKERIKASNLNEANGLPPDPWVVEFRNKNNKTKANWKSQQPKKEHIHLPNSGSFKKGMVAKNKLPVHVRKQNISAYQKQYRIANREKLNQQRRDKRKANPSFKIAGNLRKRLSFLLKKSISSKTCQTLDLLGCSMAFFIEHLKSQFQDGMSIDNYGKWHIDHRIPCNFFDLTKPDQQAKCFHYTNMQPLWAVDNLRKSNRLLIHVKI